MTDNDLPAPRPRRAYRLAVAVLLLAVAGAAGYGGWRVWRAGHDTEGAVAAQEALLIRLSHQLSDAQAEIERLRERQADLLEAIHRSGDDVARLQSRGDDFEQSLAHLSADLRGGRTRAQLVAVEQLLLLANDRAQLAHDARGAATALQLADERLSALAEPRLFEVRKAVAEERSALLAVQPADRSSAALSLAGLIGRADSLALRDRPPPAAPEPPPTSGSFADHGWSSLRDMLRTVFIVRRTDKPVDRLLPPEQMALVKQLLALKLESARAAVLLGDTASMRSALESADRWLGDYYRPEDPAVSAARAELERLRGLDLDPPLPDLGRSVGLLRAYLDAQSK